MPSELCYCTTEAQHEAASTAVPGLLLVPVRLCPAAAPADLTRFLLLPIGATETQEQGLEPCFTEINSEERKRNEGKKLTKKQPVLQIYI